MLMLRECKPFIKWTGGKGRLLAQIQNHIPSKFNTYYEPFLGGGALFFALNPKRAYLSDINEELITTYKIVRDDVENLIRKLKLYEDSSEFFAYMKSKDPQQLTPLRVAARMIYLNRHGFNGLYRVNSKGGFNVAYNPGKKSDYNFDNIRVCSERLANVKIKHRPFHHVLSKVEKRDFVYLDPPYYPISKTSNFTSYSKFGFGVKDQKFVRNMFSELVTNGVHVVASNSYCEETLHLYRNFTTHALFRSGVMNSDPTKRGKVKEMLVTR